MLLQEEHRLSRLVENILAYARVTDVTEVYSFEALRLAEVTAEALRGFRRQVAESGFEIQVDVPPTLPPVKGDRTALVLALDNLIDNAIRYSGASRRVLLTASRVAGAVEFSVVDRGIGIPTDELPRIGRRFVRGRAAAGPGSGLGLSIVTRIAADHGGHLRIESQVGTGTRATIVIPAVQD
jgi:two-component system phosphate regulon sensor histidine kinase PhoR